MAYEPPPHGFRTFLIAWATQSVSVFGSALTFFGMTIWLTQTLYPSPEQKAELAFALSAVSLSAMLPALITVPIAGAWADRHDRKRTMMLTDSLNGCLSLLLAAMLATHTLQLPTLLLIMCVSSITGTFHASAFDTSYAMIVPDRLLPRANGMMQAMWSLSSVLSPASAATVIALPALARQGLLGGTLSAALGGLQDGVPLAITLDAITFYLAAFALVWLYIPSPRRADVRAKPSLWGDVAFGARYIWYRRPLLWLLGTFAMANFMLAPIGVFQPLILKFDLASDWMAHGFTFESALALTSSAAGIGGLAGAVFVSAWGGLKRRRVMGVLGSMVISGVGMAVVGLSNWIYVTVGAVLLMMFSMPIANVHSQAIWQTQVPREFQGRVFAVRRLIAQCTNPASTMIAGILGGLFNPGDVVAVMGVLFAVVAAAQIFNPQMLRVEDKESLDAMARLREARAG